MRDSLPRRQGEILAFIEAFQAEHGWAPTVREIAAGVGNRSTAPVHKALGRLEAKGRIERSPGSPRALRVIRQEVAV